MDSSKLPIPVQNLRRIWEAKKANENVTQNDAAKALGWTQSAFSHYIVDIISLNPQAIYKLADYLGVDPREIDPDIGNDLPGLLNVDIYPTTFLGKPASRSSVKLTNHYRDKGFFVEIEKEVFPMFGGADIKAMNENIVTLLAYCVHTANVFKQKAALKLPLTPKRICFVKQKKTSPFETLIYPTDTYTSTITKKFHTHLTAIYFIPA